jgi:plasmid maintenance system antidote protein VapI
VTEYNETLWTVARIAEHLHVERHRVEYVIDTRDIRPMGRAGIARVFDRSSVELIAKELRTINENREGVTLAE